MAYWCDDDSLLLQWSGLYSGMYTGTWMMDASSSSPSLGNIPQSYSVTLWVASEEKGKSNKGLGCKELEINLGCFQIYPWCISTWLDGRVRRLSLTREGKLLWKVCLHPHLEQGGMPLVEKSHSCRCGFFLSYRRELAVPRTTPFTLTYRKQEKWGEVPYVLLFISLWDMPDLCPKGADLGVKPSAPSYALTLPLDLGLPTEQAKNQGTLPGGVASV